MNQHSTHSKPIPIATDHLRNRSSSFSSDASDSPPLVTPPKNFPTTPITASSSSPILYFLSQSPTKTPTTFPFRGFPPQAPLQDEPVEDTKPAHHARRASIAGRFQPPPPVPEAHHERGVNVLRRLSLSQRPKPAVVDAGPPPSSPPPVHDRKARRSATVVERPRRAPSPMGERILKGHFDGFN